MPASGGRPPKNPSVPAPGGIGNPSPLVSTFHEGIVCRPGNAVDVERETVGDLAAGAGGHRELIGGDFGRSEIVRKRLRRFDGERGERRYGEFTFGSKVSELVPAPVCWAEGPFPKEVAAM